MYNLYIQKIILLILIAAAAQPYLFGQIAEPLSQRIGKISEKYAAEDQFSGAVLVARNDEIIYQNSFGYADRESRTKFERATMSSIASIGKIFTSALILKLADEKKLALTDPLIKFLPAAKIPNADKITIHHLLTHTSGLGNYMAHPDYVNLKMKPLDLDALVKLAADQPLVFETPGARHEYSNSGYILLGRIIEVAARKKYEDVLKEKILAPRKMKNTRFAFDRENFKDRAQGYFRKDASGEWQSTAGTMPVPSSDGGIFTSAEDLFMFDRALFGGKIMKKNSFETMKKRHVEATVPGLGKMNYGYGLMIMDYEGGAYSIGHNGGSPGYGAEYKHYFIGRDEYTLIIISNYDRRTRLLLNQIQTELINEAK